MPASMDAMRSALAQTADEVSVRLPTQERRNIELVLVAGVMHRALPAVLVQPLRNGALGIFGDWQFLLARLGGTRHGTAREPLGRRHRGADRRGARRRRRFRLFMVTAAEADRSQSLEQRSRAVLGVAVVSVLAAPGADFILRRHGQ